MSGWDVSPTHTWGQQDGPDETQNFAAPGGNSRDFGDEFGSQEFGRMAPGSPPAGFPAAGGGFPGERSSANPPPEFFGQGGYGQQDSYGSGGYPQRTPGRSLHDLPQRDTRPAAHDAGYGQDGGYGDNGNGYGQDGGYGDNGYGQDAGYGQDWGNADQGDGWGGGSAAGRRGGQWDDRGQRDAGYQDLDGGFGRQDPGRPGYGGQDYAGQGQDYGSQDYPGQDYASPDYAGQDYAGQQGRGGLQEPSPYGRREHDATARMDPALQDFFAPQSGYAQQPGGPGSPRESRFRQEDNGWGGWDEQADRSEPVRGGTGPRPVPRAARGGGDDERRGLGTRAYVVIGLVVAIIIVGAYVVLSKGSGNKTPTAGNTPSGSMTSAAAKPSASTSAGTTTTAYKLSTPATAGGYAQGQDPHFLATATATAGQIVASVKSGGGGTVKGNPVSAAYQLPLSQVVTFVGYQGTFTPAKVATILASLGTDPNSYSAGPNGGMLGCANTPATATATSGAVCVWATSSTLGVTEFFDSTGPEALTTSQSKGAADTVKLRADVEAKA